MESLRGVRVTAVKKSLKIGSKYEKEKEVVMMTFPDFGFDCASLARNRTSGPVKGHNLFSTGRHKKVGIQTKTELNFFF